MDARRSRCQTSDPDTSCTSRKTEEEHHRGTDPDYLKTVYYNDSTVYDLDVKPDPR